MHVGNVAVGAFAQKLEQFVDGVLVALVGPWAGFGLFRLQPIGQEFLHRGVVELFAMETFVDVGNHFARLRLGEFDLVAGLKFLSHLERLAAIREFRRTLELFAVFVRETRGPKLAFGMLPNRGHGKNDSKNDVEFSRWRRIS